MSKYYTIKLPSCSHCSEGLVTSPRGYPLFESTPLFNQLTTDIEDSTIVQLAFHLRLHLVLNRLSSAAQALIQIRLINKCWGKMEVNCRKEKKNCDKIDIVMHSEFCGGKRISTGNKREINQIQLNKWNINASNFHLGKRGIHITHLENFNHSIFLLRFMR